MPTFTPKPSGSLPTSKQVLDFIASAETSVGKREIAKAFGLHGAEKIALKALLKDMADEGLIDSAPGRAFHQMGGVPKVTVLRITDVGDDGQCWAVPESWQADTPAPRLRVREKGRRGALGIGDRILARTEEAGNGWIAHPLKSLAKGEELMLGVLREEGGKLWLIGVDKRERREHQVSDAGGANPGDLVLAEKTGRPPRITARVKQVLGDPFAPRSFSMIAIHKLGIPTVFAPEAIEEAGEVAKLPLHPFAPVDKKGKANPKPVRPEPVEGLASSSTAEKESSPSTSSGRTEGGKFAREDLRHLPIVAIDPEDARDHDDAVWAAPDDDPDNAGGWKAIVAIADVSFYVRPGSAIDKEARRRGNSVYFPDRVVPMLPELLSADVCSLKAGEDRAALVCHLQISKGGALKSWRFTRGVVRIAANIAYEQAQAAIDAAAQKAAFPGFDWDGALVDAALVPLWDCWRALAAARAKRAPLDLDLPERRVILDEKGRIMSVAPRERLDAHKLIEEYMIAANVAAAKALEKKKAPVMYRDHEPPAREKLVALKDYLKTFGVEFALGQVVKPSTFNHVIDRIGESDFRPQVMEQILRTQTQAYYAPGNHGHFGLALGSYAHFTSPIRRYADLVVHRSLVAAYKLGPGGLTEAEGASMDKIGESISMLERRAMEAERDTIDRYVAAYLAERVGEVVDVRITGVQNFGFFATVEGIGGDGLMPVRDIGREYFRYDEAAKALVGEHSGDTFSSGMRLQLRLAEANPVSGALRFEMLDGKGSGGSPPSTGKPKRIIKHRGRPANIRHQGKRR